MAKEAETLPRHRHEGKSVHFRRTRDDTQSRKAGSMRHNRADREPLQKTSPRYGTASVEISLRHRRFSYELISLATKCLSFPIIDPGFSRTGIEVATSADMLVCNMTNNAAFNTDEPFEKLSVGRNGSLSLSASD